MSVEAVGLSGVETGLKQLYDRTGNLRPALAEVGNVFKNAIGDSFERGSSPFGQVWAPLKRPRKSGGNKVLVDSGQLSSRWSVRVDADSVEVGTNLPYAPIHQYGSKKSKGRGGGIPAREYLPVDSSGNIDPKTAKEAEDVISEYLTEVLG